MYNPSNETVRAMCVHILLEKHTKNEEVYMFTPAQSRHNDDVPNRIVVVVDPDDAAIIDGAIERVFRRNTMQTLIFYNVPHTKLICFILLNSHLMETNVVFASTHMRPPPTAWRTIGCWNCAGVDAQPDLFIIPADDVHTFRAQEEHIYGIDVPTLIPPPNANILVFFSVPCVYKWWLFITSSEEERDQTASKGAAALCDHERTYDVCAVLFAKDRAYQQSLCSSS